MALWTSFLHCRSSDGSESGVPNEAKIFEKGMLGPSLCFHAETQLGVALRVILDVRCAVISLTVRSESFLGLLLGGRRCCLFMNQPMFLGKAVVKGPMIEERSGDVVQRVHMSNIRVYVKARY